MKNLIRLNQNSGFTITELLIAIGLTTIVGLGIFQVLTQTGVMQKELSEKMDERIEAKLGDKLMLRDLRNAGPSLNNVTFKDDNGYNFFDFDPDRSSDFYRSQTVKKRQYTLIQKGKSFLYFLAFDDLRGKGLFADAVTFFEIGAVPATVNDPAPLYYRGINYNNYLTAKDSAGNVLNNPLLISPENLGKLVLVDSSSYMPVSPLKPAVFIGRVKKDSAIYDIEKIPPASIPISKDGKPIFSYTIKTPVGTFVEPTNFENFMYNIPPVGANGASVRIKPVRFYKYELDCADPEMCILYRHDVLHGASTQKIPVVRGFNKVVFYRDDIATSVFKISVEKVPKEKL